MAKTDKKRFLLRLDADLFDALELWAANELRSVNGQIEFLLHNAVRTAGRSREGSADKRGGKEPRRRSTSSRDDRP